ncbi:hypothetical protein N6Q81_16155 [Streptomyces vinaceusdrappus]|uniref:Uncharacterized protein n=1 Tax=Streptomyces vinaceusdrappus TaxID=67376 RepID=A0ABY6BUM2_9ACTN|nr:hypothetical protein [Streptomyces vinaceusdrappus]UXI79453.1 hypothetical protein N6Q81_16155 [Streptomyces vinaceusdrappus]
MHEAYMPKSCPEQAAYRVDAEPLRRVLEQHLFDDQIEVGQEGVAVAHQRVTPPSGVLLREHLGHDEAEREDVRRLADTTGVAPHHLLGSEVVPVDQEVPGLRERGVLEMRDTEVGQDEPTRIGVDEDVLGFDVAMHDAVAVHVRERVAEPAHVVEKHVGIGLAVDHVPQRHGVEVHDVEEEFRVLRARVDPHDVRVTRFLPVLDLPPETLVAGGVRVSVLPDPFDGEHPTVRLTAGLPHHG